MPLSYKIGKHRDNNNQNVNMHVIITLIVNSLFFNSDTMPNTLLYKMFDFYEQLFQNMQQAITTYMNIEIKYGSSFFVRTVIGTRSTCINWFIWMNVLFIGSVVFLLFS